MTIVHRLDTNPETRIGNCSKVRGQAIQVQLDLAVQPDARAMGRTVSSHTQAYPLFCTRCGLCT